MKRPAAAKSQTQDTWLVQPVVCHWATTAGWPPTLTILLHSSLAKPDLFFLCESLALQDYNNKAPDDELATVPCLDIKAWWLAMPYLFIKLVRWDNNPRDTLGSSTYTEQHQLHDLAATVCVHCFIPFSIPSFHSILHSRDAQKVAYLFSHSLSTWVHFQKRERGLLLIGERHSFMLWIPTPCLSQEVRGGCIIVNCIADSITLHYSLLWLSPPPWTVWVIWIREFPSKCDFANVWTRACPNLVLVFLTVWH